MSRSRPQILYITGHCPHAESYGAQLRALHIGRLLQECGRVSLVLLTDRELDPVAMAKTRDEFQLEALMRLFARPVRGIKERLGHELNPFFLNVNGCRLSAVDLRRIEQLAGAHDVVWSFNLYTANAAGLSRWPSSVLDVDDFMSQYYRSSLKRVKSWKDRLISTRQLWLWTLRESVLLKRFGILAVGSEGDRRYFGCHERVHVVPNGYGMTAEEPRRCPAEPPRVGFIGTLKYPPNYQGVEWFIREVWPAIKKAVPLARLRLAGAESDGEISRLGADVDGLGWIEDAAGEMSTWSLSVVPVWVGGGTRIKIAESFSRKCPVVSTTVGAFGYDVESGRELLLAEEPAAFTQACVSILRDRALGERLASAAWEKYVQNWTWRSIGPKVAAAVEHCLRYSSSPVPQKRCAAAV